MGVVEDFQKPIATRGYVVGEQVDTVQAVNGEYRITFQFNAIAFNCDEVKHVGDERGRGEDLAVVDDALAIIDGSDHGPESSR